MIWISYRNRLEKQMILYINFLPYLADEMEGFGDKYIEDCLFKLLDEIQFLKMQIQRIDRMSMRMATEIVNFKSIQQLSKTIINTKNEIPNIKSSAIPRSL